MQTLAELGLDANTWRVLTESIFPGARTDGGVIVLPDLPDGDPELRAVTWGYLAHEAAHVRHTDFCAYARGAEDGPLQAALQNIFEDIRIEQALAVPYPGTRGSSTRYARPKHRNRHSQ